MFLGMRLLLRTVLWLESVPPAVLYIVVCISLQGLLLLQQSGLMADCTQYMHHRYKLKLQVCMDMVDYIVMMSL